MITAAICLSHSPLLERARAEPAVEQEFRHSVKLASLALAETAPDAIVVFYPDHMNGFFHGQIPDFALCETADSLGDWGTAPGALDVPIELVRSLADWLEGAGQDIPLLQHLVIDHGATQPIELLSSSLPIIPVFINCVVAPRPNFRSVEKLGKAVGEWAQASTKRIAIIGSGGLSHDPPLPQRSAAMDAEGMGPRVLDHSARVSRQNRVFSAAEAFAAGHASQSRSLAPDWDIAFMDALAAGQTAYAADWTDAEVTETGGNGGHEVRCWVAAMAALSAAGNYCVSERYYRPVPEWLTGMGVMVAAPQDQQEA